MLSGKSSKLQTFLFLLRVSEAKLDHEDKEDQRGPGDREGPGARLENQEPKERRAATGPTDLLESGVCQALREPTDSQGRKDLPDLLGKMDFLDTQDSEEKWVSKAKWDHQDRLESLDLRAHQERPARWGSVATPDPRGPLESRACRALRGRRAPRETPVPQVDLARMDPQDSEASLGREGCPVLLVEEV